MSRRRLYKHEVAKASLAKDADYLAKAASLDVALRFLEKAEEAFSLLLEMPGVGHPQELRSLKLGNIRSWPIRGFENWLIYYREVDDAIEILDVIHGAMDKEQRLKERFKVVDE